MTADLKIHLQYRGRPRIDPGRGRTGRMKLLQQDFLCFLFSHLPNTATAKDQPCEIHLCAWLCATSIPREWLGDASSKLCCFPQLHQYLGSQQQARLLGHHCLGLILTLFARKTSAVAVAGRLPVTPGSPWGEEHACKNMSERLPQLKGSKTLLKAKSH